MHKRKVLVRKTCFNYLVSRCFFVYRSDQDLCETVIEFLNDNLEVEIKVNIELNHR